ncbi:hypothetical protein JOF29_006914 [Kribbella aluminosa]|uniref:Uncharacterized protein n=1 Tax=Kribbella aluminosa TaxID=416017 RepID=A0ABS4UVY4_9ACTN|nr:hypothetical protein [Kribbella aluminosa]MBP2355804.1 hypothetical protein [Kribbella aluminosa]
MSELRGRAGDREPSRPEQIPDPRPDRPDPEPEEPLPDWADRYPLEVRRQLATDDTIARLHHISPRAPTEPSAIENADQDPLPRVEHDAAEPVREPSIDHLLHLPAKLRDQMANDPVFTRAGWARDDPDSPQNQPRPSATDDSNRAPARPSPTLEQPATPQPTEQKPPHNNPPQPPRLDAITDHPTTPTDRPAPAVQDHRPPPNATEPHPQSVDPPADREPHPPSVDPRGGSGPRPPFVDPTDDARTTSAEASRRPAADQPLTAPLNAGGDGSDQADDLTASEFEADPHVEGTDTPEHEFIETPDDPRDMDTYRRIREADDLDAVATNSGYPREVVEVAKDNLFIRQHDVVVKPGEVKHGNFTPLQGIGPLWERVASGAELTDRQRTEFWSLVAHEYVEAKLMAAGVPYLMAEPDAWDEDGRPKVEREYPTAHTVAPLSLQSARKDLLRLWDTRLDIPRGDLRVAEDLSNLDEVVRVARKGLGL